MVDQLELAAGIGCCLEGFAMLVGISCLGDVLCKYHGRAWYLQT